MKKLFLVVGVLVVVVLGAIAALVTLVNPNQFKPLLVEQTKKQTGLDLVIEGDIGWQFFPAIGFELGKTELKNPQGFSSPNLFKVDSVGIDVSVMPLLDKQLHIGNIRLDGAEVHLETLKDGRTNLDSLSKAQDVASKQTDDSSSQANTESATPSEQASTEQAWSINLAGVSVNNALLEIQDQQAGTMTKLYDVQLAVSEFAADTWTSVDFSAKGSMNQQQFGASGQAEIKLSQDFTQYALRNINLDANFSDAATKIDSAKVTLDTFEFDKANKLTFAVKGKAADMDLDASGGASVEVDKDISKVAVNQLDMTANLEGAALPQSPMKVTMQSDVAFDITKSTLNLVLEKLTANALQFDGKANVVLGDIAKVRFNLHSPDIDLDEFLGLNQKAVDSDAAAGSGESKPAVAKQAEAEPDLSALKTLDVAGDIVIDKFKASNAKMQNVKTSFAVNRGIVDLKSFSANLYEGRIAANARIDARQSPASYTVKNSVSGVKVQPLLKDVADNDRLEGTGNIEMNLQGKSLTPTGIKQNLAGTVGINFADGAVNGINIAQMIRTNYARFKGEAVDETKAVQKTDFSAMTATLKLSKGEVTTNDLNMQSPLLRIHGEGKANYIQETVDFLVRTSIVGTLQGQGGKNLDELRDVTIPINVSGQWADPKFRLVFDDVLKEKAKKEVDRGLEKLNEKLDEKIKDEKTKKAVDGLLKGLFN
ncbi:AsmA family protein [Vibrio sp. ABG19]|uniref:AsmA family protein n=1 Tax=Vibrio sp. ABG19 TaxID=2817385 RepID=UPI00249F0DAF|nr:AsmA family protein [Vibrio sp. ABG19]WGY46445.1 AsmA family protein [Vibrio sp. ABG19]